MVFGGLIAILIAVWIYQTDVQFEVKGKKLPKLFWVAGSFILYMIMQFVMIEFNVMIIEIFDTDINSEYDNAGGLKARENDDTAGLQSGTGGTLIGIIFELLPFIVPFFVVAIIRQIIMLKQSFNFMGLFDGLKEMFISIKDSFKTT